MLSTHQINVLQHLVDNCEEYITDLAEENGVKNTDVFLKSGKAEVTTADSTKPEVLCGAVVKAGYECKVAK